MGWKRWAQGVPGPMSLSSFSSRPFAALVAALTCALVLPASAASRAPGAETRAERANPSLPQQSASAVDRAGTPEERTAAVLASRSVGRPARGRLEGGVPFEDAAAARLLPRRHAARGLNYGTQRLVEALHRAGAAVREALPDSPPLGVGNISAPQGGPIPRYSRSHQSGRDADLAFYQLDTARRPVAAEDLGAFDRRGRALRDGAHFDVERTWLLVRALLTDPTIDVQWLFISRPLKALLLAQAHALDEPRELLERAGRILHQPTDSSPHADHLHLRIRCNAEERALGCVD